MVRSSAEEARYQQLCLCLIDVMPVELIEMIWAYAHELFEIGETCLVLSSYLGMLRCSKIVDIEEDYYVYKYFVDVNQTTNEYCVRKDSGLYAKLDQLESLQPFVVGLNDAPRARAAVIEAAKNDGILEQLTGRIRADHQTMICGLYYSITHDLDKAVELAANIPKLITMKSKRIYPE